MSDNFSKQYGEGRIVLKDAIPLRLPLCVSIEPSNICNFKCKMCYQSEARYSELARPLTNMSMDYFNKAVDDLKNWCKKSGEKIKLMKLYSVGEPLLHENIGKMVSVIKAANICNKLEITTNASLLTEERARRLVDNGLDYLRISVYSVDEGGNEKFTGSNISRDDIYKNVEYIMKYKRMLGKEKPVICAKLIDTFSDENSRFLEMYQPLVDEAYVDQPMDSTGGAIERLFGDRALEVKTEASKKLLYKERKACRYPFTHLTVKSDGRVVVCCSDWAYETNVGDIRKSTLEEIWNGKPLYNFRCMMLKTKGVGISVCSKCEIPFRNFEEDNIDDFPIERLDYWK